MKKAPNKHRPGKSVAAPVKQAITPVSLKVIFYYDDQSYCWKALRNGKVVAQSAEGYTRRDKMKRTFLRFAESLSTGNWQLDEGHREKS